MLLWRIILSFKQLPPMKSMYRKALLPAAIALCSSQLAFAQDESEGVDEITFEEVVILGQKIERTLFDTKESVAVFTDTMLVERNIVSLQDIYNQTAGVSGDQFGFRIRGISSGETGTMRSELASIYVDGVALTGWLKSEGPREMWDVEQVEVLRGPQSTNVGRNSLAGAIIVKTKDPSFKNEGKIQLGAGQYGRLEARAMGNLVLADDKAAIRVTIDDTQHDGFVTNLTRDEDDYAFDKRQTLRLKGLWQTTDDLRMVLSYQHIDNSYGDSRVLFESSGYLPEDQISTNDIRGNYGLKADLASLTIDYDINEQWSLKAITAGMSGDRERVSDYDRSESDEGIVLRDAEDTNFSQELRFNFSSDNWLGSTGLFYGNSESYNVNDTTIFLNLEQQINALSPGLGTTLVGFGIYPALYDLNTGGYNNFDVTTQALFTEWEYQLNDKVRLSLGARYDYEDQDMTIKNNGSSTTVLPTVPSGFGDEIDGAIGLINPQLEALSTTTPEENTSTNFSAFLPQAGITVDWTGDMNTSFFVKRGYRSGGTELTGLSTKNAYDSSYLLNYELSFRSIIFDGKGIFNANTYYGDWKDQQVSVPEIPNSSVFFIIENAGESELYGLEAEFNYLLNDYVSLYASGAISHTEYKEFFVPNDDYSGNEFKYAPRHTAALGFDYRQNQGIFINANVTYQGKSYANDANDIELDPYALLNVRAGYETPRYSVEAYVTNLADKVYKTAEWGLREEGEFTSGHGGRMGAPMQIGARVTVNF